MFSFVSVTTGPFSTMGVGMGVVAIVSGRAAEVKVTGSDSRYMVSLSAKAVMVTVSWGFKATLLENTPFP